MRHKTTKSISKRIRITKNGKLVRRKMGIDHFKSKKTGKQRRQKRNLKLLRYSRKKIISY
ncbi:MAG: 50S ribosomal protein L35 [bacterium]|nr:50S ribosomal protein L35 [bacterium]